MPDWFSKCYQSISCSSLQYLLTSTVLLALGSVRLVRSALVSFALMITITFAFLQSACWNSCLYNQDFNLLGIKILF